MDPSSQRWCRLILLPLVVLCLSGATPKPGDITLQEGASYRAEGRQLQEVGDLHRALAAYRMAIVVHPGYAEAYNDLAVVLESLGKSSEAEEAYQRALRLKPELAAAHSNLALLYEAQGRIQEAGEHWVSRIRLGPSEDRWVVKARERILHHNLGLPPEPEAPPAKPLTQRFVKRPSEEDRLRRAREEAEKVEKRRVRAQEEAKRRREKEIEAARVRLARQELSGLARQQKAAQAKVKKPVPQPMKPAAPKPAVAPPPAAGPKGLPPKAGPPSAETSGGGVTKRPALEEAPPRASAQRPAMKEAPPPLPAPARLSRPHQAGGPSVARQAGAPLQLPVPSDASRMAQQVAEEKGRLRQKSVNELYQRGLTAMRGGRYDEAAQVYRQILALDPNHRDAQQGLDRAEKAKSRTEARAAR